MYYVYFAKSLKNNKVYVGLTKKTPAIRIGEHNRGSNKWSNNNKPLKLIYFETYRCKEDATARERFYKTGVGKRAKKCLVKEFDK